MAPWISDQYKADPFPVPRYYDSPTPSPPSPLPKLANKRLPPSPSSSLPPSTSLSAFFHPHPPHPSSSTSHPHPPHFHLSTSPFPSLLTRPLHALESSFLRTHRASAEALAESRSHFPDASGATRGKPYLPDQRRQVRLRWAMGVEEGEVSVAGEVVAAAAGYRVEVWDEREGSFGFCEVGMHGVGTEPVTTLCWSLSGRYLWVGGLSGGLYEFDSSCFTQPLDSVIAFRGYQLFPPVAHRQDAHPSGQPVVKIAKVGGDRMYTLDEGGRLVVWLSSDGKKREREGEEEQRVVSLHGHSKVLQLPPNFDFVEVLGKEGLVWMAWNEMKDVFGGAKQVVCRVFEVSGTKAVLKGEKRWGLGTDFTTLGQVTSACIVPSHPGFVFVGHGSGHVSIWRSDGSKLLDVAKVSLTAVTALVGPSRFLWVGTHSGFIDIIDLGANACQPDRWKVVKRFRAHKGKVASLSLDATSLWMAEALRVVSTGSDFRMRFWDGLLREDWLVKRMSTRVDSYYSFRPLKLGIFSFNVDGQNPDLLQNKPVNQKLLGAFLKSLDRPDLVVFNFQELIDLSDLTLAARTVLFATQQHDVTGRYRHWRDILEDAVKGVLGEEYRFVKEEKLVGLYTIVFARRAIKHQIRDLAFHRIKNGYDGMTGNKGSILFRLVIDDSSFCFINSHLAAGKTHGGERERDLISILDAGGLFPRPQEETHRAYIGGGDGTAVSDCEMVFFSGDLNFRIDLPHSTVLSTLSTSPSPQRAISTLLPHDELTLLRASNPSFRLRSFFEAPICFAPTYKYDHGSAEYDTSAKQRTPSWCDRILWRAERKESVKAVAYGRFEADISDHRPVAAIFEVQVRKVNPLLAEQALREATHAWARESEALLQAARSYNPPDV
ncbi:hypothetical protein JCM8547_006284 [Rhodosporidiobolus lusitaniae]